MAAPVLGRTPTCLNCIRRIVTAPTPSPLASSCTSWTVAPISPFSRPQIRNKSKHHYDEGVIVRLLEDIPRYGRKDAIFRVDRGRMRNLWYPKNKAEYMTVQRFAELGLSRKSDVGEREHDFRAHERAGQEVEEEAEAAPAAMTAAEEAVSAYTLAPERIYALLATLVVPTITFHRKPIPAAVAPEPETPAPKRSPLLAQHVHDLPPSLEKKKKDSKTAAEPQAIFGSVSTTDILLAIKSDLALDPEASRIPLDARSIRFVGMEDEDADRVKTLGEWEVEIAVPGASRFVPEVQFVRRTVQVLPAEDAE
ncbi:hypothetical protein GE09DRAFT_1213209 [Coniochaeta sp. 2T2.1]|nr:hypothetical protein GE09DRAFT_1213209 [Coniochaeta sp. 2T2.1]